MRKKSLVAVAVCTAALAGAGASAAFAGEVKGPPLAPGETGTPYCGAGTRQLGLRLLWAE